MKVKSLSCVRLLETPWTVAYQAPPSMGFSRQEYWSGVPLPSPVLDTGNTVVNKAKILPSWDSHASRKIEEDRPVNELQFSVHFGLMIKTSIGTSLAIQ